MINNVNLIGNVTRSELKKLGNDFCILEFGIAVNDRKKVNGEWVDYPHFFDVSLPGQRAEKLAQWIVKGTKVAVSGKLTQQRWERDGKKNSKVSIEAYNVEFMSRAEGSQSASKPSSDAYRSHTQQVVDTAFQGAQVSAYSDSEIPF